MSLPTDPPSHPAPFTRWAHDPARSIDERYLVWVLCHAVQTAWWDRQPAAWRQGQRRPGLFDSSVIQYYRLNPALVPPYDEDQTEFAARHADCLTVFTPPRISSDSRPIRDAGALRFFPALESVSLGPSALSDISWVADLPRLHTLHLHSGELEDLGPLTRAPQLRHLHLHLGGHQPDAPAPPLLWPDARPLAALQDLETLHYSPNAAALQGLCFPRLREAHLTCVGQRDAHCLPEMPAVTVLHVTGLSSLHGIGRYPELRNLTVAGPLRDLGDLPALHRLTSLTMNTEAGWPRDVSPLATLPELRVAEFGGENPRNYWPMAAAPRLRHLGAPRAVGVALDVQAINAALLSWDGDFLAPTPRQPLPPLRVVARRYLFANRPEQMIVEPDKLTDPEMFYRELVWMSARLHDAAHGLIGHPDGLHDWRYSGPSRLSNRRQLTLSVQTQDLADRLPEFVETIRQTMAGSTHDWEVHIVIMLRVPTHLFDEQRKKWLKQVEAHYARYRDETPEERDEEIERYRKTQQHLIESAHRLRTAAEDGETPLPEDFEPPEIVGPVGQGRVAPVAAGSAPAAADDDEDDEEDDDEDEVPDAFRLLDYDEQEKRRSEDGDEQQGGEGGPAVKSDPDPPEWFFDDPNGHPLRQSYFLHALLTWDTLFVETAAIATAESLMRRGVDEIISDHEN